jgi:antitoxin VapB
MATSTVFTNNRTQAFRMPVEVWLHDGLRQVLVRVRGNERIISPMDRTWGSFFLNGPPVSDDFMVNQASQTQTEREAL